MTDQKTAPKIVTDEEKRRGLDAAYRKFFLRLGVDLAAYDSAIRIGLQGNLSPEQEHELSKVKGLQIVAETATRELLPQIRTQEDLDSAVRSLEASLEEAPTLVRKELDRIRRELPRRGGPGRKHKLNDEEKARACDAIMQHIRGGMTTTKAIKATVDECPKLLGKKVGQRTLEEAWSERKKFPGK
jgi:hypothetical protein